jgi:hypothetical protein
LQVAKNIGRLSTLSTQIKFNPGYREALKNGNRALIVDMTETMMKHVIDFSPYDTGNNKRSIQSDIHPVEPWARVYTTSGYGAYLELGTVHMSGRYYFRRAFENTKAEINENRRKK